MTELQMNTPDNDYSKICEKEGCKEGYILLWNYEHECYEKEKCIYCDENGIEH